MTASPPCVVVGSGPQGLAFALEALRRGRPVIVVEKASKLGGQSKSFRYDGFTFDSGMHALVTRQSAVTSWLRRALGKDLRVFRAKAATWRGPGRIVEDGPALRLPARRGALWNCMRVGSPPSVLYPRRGGFGAMFERVAREIEERGGRFLLKTRVARGDFVVRGRQLTAMRLRGRNVPVSGCYWAAGGEGGADDSIALFHFLVKGRAPMTHHWVRIDADNALLPALVYFPARFSADNAPAGHYGVAAAVPFYHGGARTQRAKALVADWYGSRPRDFIPWISRFMDRAGFLREDRVLAAHCETLPAPVDRLPTRQRRAWEKIAPNFWIGDRWLEETPGESLVAVKIAAALRAADALFGATR